MKCILNFGVHAMFLCEANNAHEFVLPYDCFEGFCVGQRV